MPDRLSVAYDPFEGMAFFYQTDYDYWVIRVDRIEEKIHWAHTFQARTITEADERGWQESPFPKTQQSWAEDLILHEAVSVVRILKDKTKTWEV
jgi:hypothetical protein